MPSFRIYTAFFLFFFSLFQAVAQNPQVEILHSGTGISLRGLSVVNDQVIWVSGSKGTVGRSVNGGESWNWTRVAGFEETEFRDVEAFDAVNAIIMAAGEPAFLLRTTNGGVTWKVTYENKGKGMFLDAMEFWNERSGIVIGDPVDGHFFVARTFDGGSTWQELPLSRRPSAEKGEACFAASGTNVRARDLDEAVFVSGGHISRIHYRDKAIALPFATGRDTHGANSVAIWDNRKRKGGKILIVVGGNFQADSLRTDNCYLSSNGGQSWQTPETPPLGYRSCVEFFSRLQVFSCGLNGVDYSADGGKNWKGISGEGFHVCRKAARGKAVFLAGSNGKIARIRWK